MNRNQIRKGIEHSPRVCILLAIALLGEAITLTTCAHPGTVISTPVWLPTTTHTQIVTLEEARQMASFHLLEPTYLPDSIRLVKVTQIDDAIDLEYQNPAQSEVGTVPLVLSISESQLNYPPGFSTPLATPDMGSETTLVRGVRALVDRNSLPPANVSPMPSTLSFTAVRWIENHVGITLIGSFNLDEIKKIAESLK